MPWIVRDTNSNRDSAVDGSVDAKSFENTKSELLPIAHKESLTGAKTIQPIDFQPVKSPGNYEAEFAVKGEDVIFHFWPWGYHEAERRGVALPRFKKNFAEKLNSSMAKTFGQHRIQISEDPDMGAFFVKAVGFGINQFHRELCIEACENLHNEFEG
jgi:hypothetical protein